MVVVGEPAQSIVFVLSLKNHVRRLCDAPAGWAQNRGFVLGPTAQNLGLVRGRGWVRAHKAR